MCKNTPQITLACVEEADDEVERRHTHIAYISEKEGGVCRSTVRTLLKKTFPDASGNEDFSITCKLKFTKFEENRDALYRYICKGTDHDWDKGKPNIIYNKLGLIDVKYHHAKYWMVQEEFIKEKEAIGKKLAKESAKSQNKMIEELATEFKGRDIHEETLNEIIVGVLKSTGGKCNRNYIQTSVQAVCWRINPAVTARAVMADIKEHYFKKLISQSLL